MRGFTLIALVVVVVLIVVAISREWITFDWATRDNSKSQATVTVDREKIKEDIGSAENKVRQALTPKSSTVRGTVTAVNSESLQIRTTDQNDVQVRLTPETTVRRAEERLRVGDLSAGDEVTVETRHSNAGQEATSITVQPRR